MLRTFHIPAKDLRDGDTVDLSNLYPADDGQVVPDTVGDKFEIYDGRIWLSFKNHSQLNGHYSREFPFVILVDVVPASVNTHIRINQHKCSCGWEGDNFSVHGRDVRERKEIDGS